MPAKVFSFFNAPRHPGAAATAIAHWYKVDRYDRDYVRGYRRRERVRLARNVMVSAARILLGRVEGYSYDEFMGWLQKP